MSLECAHIPGGTRQQDKIYAQMQERWGAQLQRLPRLDKLQALPAVRTGRDKSLLTLTYIKDVGSDCDLSRAFDDLSCEPLGQAGDSLALAAYLPTSEYLSLAEALINQLKRGGRSMESYKADLTQQLMAAGVPWSLADDCAWIFLQQLLSAIALERDVIPDLVRGKEGQRLQQLGQIVGSDICHFGIPSSSEAFRAARSCYEVLRDRDIDPDVALAVSAVMARDTAGIPRTPADMDWVGQVVAALNGMTLEQYDQALTRQAIRDLIGRDAA